MPEIRYTKDHEYVRIEGGEGVVGISEHAQQQLLAQRDALEARLARFRNSLPGRVFRLVHKVLTRGKPSTSA